ncbi:MAG: FAD-dependent oxidoreductase, partial [Nanoarchaeota archaeon]|nr:FAD-dependent oxidoreductase [Nanoarchaeota archaeon]
MKEYDVIVIGSGGGTKISTPAALMGKKAAIIEEGPLGGTCLNRGCIPSKMLIYPGNVANFIRSAEKFDMKTSVKDINFENIIKRINKVVNGQSKGIEKNYRSNNIKTLDFFDGHGKFISDKVIEVNGEKITAKNIVIATGAKPSIPQIEGLKDVPYMTSTEALKNTKLPKKMIIIGGGYIACELGHAYGALGAEVHFLVRSELIRNEDHEIRKEFTKEFSKLYHVHYTSPIKVEYKNKEFIVTTKDKKGKNEIMKSDALLVATGVVPNTNNLGLENTKIKTSDKGFIEVNKNMETK